jgi:TolB-like protein
MKMMPKNHGNHLFYTNHSSRRFYREISDMIRNQNSIITVRLFVKQTFSLLYFLLPLFASQNIEIKIQSLCDSLVRQFPDSIASPRMAVLPFTDNTGKSQGQAVAEMVVSCLQKAKRFALVDRIEFQKALSEIELSQADIIDSASALKVGKMLSAPYLLSGTIATVFGACRINAKIIHTETMRILSSAWVAVSPAELDGLTKELLGERGKISAALFRSMVAPGWGQFYTDHPIRGGVSLAAFLGGVGVMAYSIYKSDMAYNDYQAFDGYHFSTRWNDSVTMDSIVTHKSWNQIVHEDSLKVQQKWKNYSDAYERMVVVTIATASVYALNLLDAALAGAQSKRKFKLYFSGDLRKNVSFGLAYRF